MEVSFDGKLLAEGHENEWYEAQGFIVTEDGAHSQAFYDIQTK